MSKRRTIPLIAASLTFGACGDSKNDDGKMDGGGGTGSTDPTLMAFQALVAEAAKAYCADFMECDPDFSANYDSLEDCELTDAAYYSEDLLAVDVFPNAPAGEAGCRQALTALLTCTRDTRRTEGCNEFLDPDHEICDAEDTKRRADCGLDE